MPLVPCDSCRRHVRASDDACPFCKTMRAATSAIVVAASALALAGCGKESATVAAYGGPPPMASTAPPDVDAGPPLDASPRLGPPPDAGPVNAMQPMYGAPPRRKP